MHPRQLHEVTCGPQTNAPSFMAVLQQHSSRASGQTTWPLVRNLIVRDYQQQYQGAYLGFLWVYLQPLLFIGVLYMIFTLGFRPQSTVDMPFALYLVCGMISWTYFSANLTAITGVIRQHGYLIKKVDVELAILPVVKLASSLLPHVFLLCIAVGLAWKQGYAPSLYTLQVFYYLAASAVLLLGLGWITSSSALFIKDVSQIVAIVTQFGFWLTPIFWNISMVPEQYQWLVKLNPVHYIVTGYRDSIVQQVGVWERPQETLYFWCVALILFGLGRLIFGRLRAHFAEVI